MPECSCLWLIERMEDDPCGDESNHIGLQPDCFAQQHLD